MRNLRKAVQIHLFFHGTGTFNELIGEIERELLETNKIIDELKEAKGLMGNFKRIIFLNRRMKILNELHEKIMPLKQIEGFLDEIMQCIECDIWKDVYYWSKEILSKLKEKEKLFFDHEKYNVKYVIFRERVKDLHEYLKIYHTNNQIAL